jgi:prepilin-type N-terminal cleavage/methylation domain-containing protein
MKKSAFTLIELLVVIVIIGILATIGVAQFNEYQEKARMARSIAFESQANKLLLAKTAVQGTKSIAAWDFDDLTGRTTNDTTGSGNILTSNINDGNNFVTDTPDGSPSAFYANERYMGNNSPSFSSLSNELSISFWIKPITYQDASYIALTTTPNAWGTRLSNQGQIIFYLDFLDQSFNSGTTKIALNKWHQVLLSYDGTTKKIYIDGLLAAEQSASVILPNDATLLGVGHSYDVDQYIDRLRIYPVGLDEGSL